jgi:hypothetical protein
MCGGPEFQILRQHIKVSDTIFGVKPAHVMSLRNREKNLISNNINTWALISAGVTGEISVLEEVA